VTPFLVIARIVCTIPLEDCEVCSPGYYGNPLLGVDGKCNRCACPLLNEENNFSPTCGYYKRFKVAFIFVKAVIAPRPANWILERSIDGYQWQPWQYFALNDNECKQFYNRDVTPDPIKYTADDEVICTSHFSRLDPLTNGEIIVSLANDRPGSANRTETLLNFTTARYVRLRL